jgi:glycine oxidase
MSLLRSPGEESSVIHIVGQGLAGSTLALRLHELGYRVRVYDNGYKTSSSRVAAGMWNPMSFLNVKRSWLSHLLLPVLEKTYPALEQKLKSNFYHPMPLLRIFPDAGAANLWEEKSTHPEVASWMSSSSWKDSETHYVQPFGTGVVNGAGWLDLPLYLDAARSFFIAHNVFEERDVSAHEILEWLKEGDFVVQCTGWKPMSDNLWADLPIQTNKGQVITVRAQQLADDYMSNFGKFMIPLGNGLFRSGSTYEHGALDSAPSDAANEIQEDIRKSMKHPFSVIDHKAGFRPTTRDRHPVVGMHDVHDHLGVLNGFGSRGVMLVPFFVEHLIEHLMHGTPIMTEVHWKRFEERRLRKQL